MLDTNSNTKRLIQKLLSEIQSKNEFLQQLVFENAELREKIKLQVEQNKATIELPKNYMSVNPFLFPNDHWKDGKITIADKPCENKMRWIKFKERKPERTGIIAVQGVFKELSFIDFKDSDDQIYYEDGLLNEHFVVWVRLPELLEE